MSGVDGLDLAGIRARADAATPGPWESAVARDRHWNYVAPVGTDEEGDPLRAVARCVDDDTTKFIAAARSDVPALLDALQRAVELLSELTDPDPCWFDHNGDCQAHGWTIRQPGGLCGHEQARQFVAAVGAVSGGQG